MRKFRFTSGSWLTLAFTLVVVLMLWNSMTLSSASAWIPRTILWVTLPLLLLQLGREILTAVDETGPETGRHRKTLSAIAWIGLQLSFAWLLGATLGCSLFCLIWLRWHAGESWSVSLTFAAILGLTLWLLFAVLLGTSLYTGLLGNIAG